MSALYRPLSLYVVDDIAYEKCLKYINNECGRLSSYWYTRKHQLKNKDILRVIKKRKNKHS